MHTLTRLALAAVLMSGGAVAALAQTPPPQAPAPTGEKPAVAPGINPDGLWDGRKIMPFHALDDPKMVPASEADFLQDGDYVLGITVNGESRAYPTRFVWFHHVINDSIGSADHGGAVPVAVSSCSVCNTGVRFDPTIDGRPIKLDFYGLYNGVVALCERETQSVVLQVDGRVITGPLMGKALPTRPMLDTTWGRWKALHPDTLVMSPDTPYRRFYSPPDHPEPRGYDRFPAPFFRPTVTRGDLRLPAFDKVLAVTLARHDSEGHDVGRTLHRAYPMATLQKRGCVVNDKLGDTPVVVFLEPDTQTANAFSRRLDNRWLDFTQRAAPDGKPGFYDRQTGTRWNIEGVAQEGPLVGKSLTHLDNHLSQWYGWAAYFPDTSVYGVRGGPKPGDPFAAVATVSSPSQPAPTGQATAPPTKP